MVVKRKGCSFFNCPLPRVAQGLCMGHRAQRKRGIKLRPLSQFTGKKCEVEHCNRIQKSWGICASHYMRVMSATVAEGEQRSCTAPGCKLRHYAKDLCKSHYQVLYFQKTNSTLINKIQIRALGL